MNTTEALKVAQSLREQHKNEVWSWDSLLEAARTIEALSALSASDSTNSTEQQPNNELVCRDAIALVCEGWTLPADARKILEKALWSSAPQASDSSQPVSALTDEQKAIAENGIRILQSLALYDVADVFAALLSATSQPSEKASVDARASEIAAKMPDGSTAENVYEAFERGKEFAMRASQPSAWNEAIEQAAKVCEGRIGGAVQNNEWWSGFRSAMKQCAASIRALRQQAPAVQEDGLLSEIRALAECGVSHGLLADDYCSQIVAKIDAAPHPAPAQTGEKTK